MKVAVCISGQLRTWEFIQDFQKKFWETGRDIEQIDYFVHTWNYSQDRNGVSKEYETRDISFEEFNRFLEIYEPKKYIFDDKKISYFYKEDHWSSLFYSLTQSLMLKKKYELENNFKYDIVVKSRPDICFSPDYKFLYNGDLSNNILFHTHGGLMPIEFWMFNPNDICFYGNSYTMDLIANMYFYRQMHINDNLNTDLDFTQLGPGVAMMEYARDYGITCIPEFSFLETIAKKGHPVDIDLSDRDDFLNLEKYFRDWYSN